MASELFRANVGIALVKQGRVLVFERADIPGAWQLPQGGIDQGEAPIEAAYRELHEETGLGASSVMLVGEYTEWLAYAFPPELTKGAYLGQVQRWFVFKMLVDDSLIRLDTSKHVEFSRFKWINVAALPEIAVSFRIPIYAKLSGFINELPI